MDLATRSVLVITTLRPEEADSAVLEIAMAEKTRSIQIERFSASDTDGMVRGMFTLPHGELFVDFLHRQSDGNPFFIVEYLRAAISEGLLSRRSDGCWYSSATDQISVRLPTTLADLIEQRLSKLSPSARSATLSAAVLGREADASVIAEVAEFSDGESNAALDELLQRHIVEHIGAGQVRFAHDKLREVTYSQASRSQLTVLHARAASALEKRLPQGPDANRHYAAIGHHYAMGDLASPAARYLGRAAEHASATYAIGDAIGLYREAIKNATAAFSLGHRTDDASLGELVGFQEALADLLVVSGARLEARTAYGEALTVESPSNAAIKARLFRKVGKTWELDHQHDEALRFYMLAQQAAGDVLPHAEEEQRHEWIQVRIEQVQTYYWLARVPEMDAIISVLQPTVERYGSRSQRIRFFHAQMQVNMRRCRYVANDQTIGLAKAALDLALEGSEHEELLTAHFQYGFGLLFHYSLGLAKVELEAALALARQSGNTALQARCLTYLTLALRMAGESEPVNRLAIESEAVATASGMRDYVAVACANRAWYALRGDNLADAIRWARAALEIWQGLAFAFPLQWTALLPLMEAELRLGNLESAVACANGMLLPNQQHIQGAATDALMQSTIHWRSGRFEQARATLELSLEQLRDTVYF